MVAQLMRVCGGLDSMIIGETEVLGQVKRAYELALEEGTTGPITNRLFGHAIAAGKRVQTETVIGALKVSVSSAAVELARETLGDLDNKKSIVIGAGGNGELTARALSDAGVDTVFVANRHYDRAIGVAEGIGGKAVRFEKLPDELISADIVLSSTGSPHALIHPDEMRMVMDQRDGRPLLMIDIAVPRDIDARGRRAARNHPLRHGRPADRRRPQPLGAPQRVGQGRDHRRPGSREVRALDGHPRRDPDDLRAAQARRVDRRTGRRPRTRASSKTSPTPTARASRRWPARSSRACCTSRRLKLKKSSGEDDAYLYIQALRDLFALDAGAPL